MTAQTLKKKSAAPSALPHNPAFSALAPQTPAELCRHVALREIYERSHIFDVDVKGASLTVQFSKKNPQSNCHFKVREAQFFFDSELVAHRHAKALRQLEPQYNA